MPEIDEVIVKKIARLANLSLDDQEIARFSGQLEKILDYFHKLNQLDASGVPETAHALPLENVWRQDEARPGLARDEALAGAPDVHKNSFRVPRIIE